LALGDEQPPGTGRGLHQSQHARPRCTRGSRSDADQPDGSRGTRSVS
jgi:hypothetical protein